MKLNGQDRHSFFQTSQTLTVILILLASALVFKSCDSGETKDDRTKNNSVPGADESEVDGNETGAAPTETGTDVPDTTKTVYTLKIDLDPYVNADVAALRFYLAEKSGAKKTFLKEVATLQSFDFANPTVTLSSNDLESIEDYVDAEACVTVKAVREGVESDESGPFCIAKW